MGICAPDMNSCAPKCKICGGVNSGKVYNCGDPCSCYKSGNVNVYQWNGSDCVKANPCAPAAPGSTCSGTLGVVIGFNISSAVTGVCAVTKPENRSSYDAVQAILGTQLPSPYSSGSLYFNFTVTSQTSSNYPTGYNWLWLLPTLDPSVKQGGSGWVLPGFGGDAIIRFFPYLTLAGGGNSGIQDTPYWFGLGQPSALVPCCGCTPCTLESGCPGPFQCCPVPASSGELYGKVRVQMNGIIVATRWLSGPNAATSVWTGM